MDDLLNVFEVAELLRVSRQTVDRMAKSGRLPGRRVGRFWRFSREQIKRWVEDGELKVQGK